MERFTERDEHGDLYVKEHDYISASKKLAEYEDTGLTPEQIIQMERENIKLNKQNEEIQNRKIKYYYRAKDAEDRCKKIEQQNARLKELLKAAPGDIHTLLMSDNCEKVCRESGCHCTTVEQCRNICKWRYADEVEEVLGDE